MEESLRAIEEAEHIDASNPDVWYNVSLRHFLFFTGSYLVIEALSVYSDNICCSSSSY